MRRSRRAWWSVFAACAVLAVGGVAWLTDTVVDLEHARSRARAETRHQANLRAALWTMDSLLAALVARDAPRLAGATATTLPDPSATSIVLSYFVLHGQGVFEASGIGSEARRELLARVLTADLVERVGRGEETLARLDPPRSLAPPGDPAAQYLSEPDWNGLQNEQEFAQRSFSNNANVIAQNANPFLTQAPTELGPLVPLWLECPASDGPPDLVFVRRVGEVSEGRLEGFVADWHRVRDELLAAVGHLVPGARLEPQLGSSSGEALPQLASIPALLVHEFVPPPPPPLPAALRGTLALAWGATLLVLGAVGFTLRASVAYGERRNRFASAVTHELRTPLTTFRMYSEMLATGMVPEDRRLEYLTTLQREADRLSALVENVLAYARLEEGTTPRRRERVGVRELVERALPELTRRTAGAGSELRVPPIDDALVVCCDVEAAKQILFNLVDNACKYGAGPIELAAAPAADGVVLEVRDHGPGIPPAVHRAVFRPFDRGAVDPADPHPGLGLGLALARGLARNLGGELTLVDSAEGACFRLRLPLS